MSNHGHVLFKQHQTSDSKIMKSRSTLQNVFSTYLLWAPAFKFWEYKQWLNYGMKWNEFCRISWVSENSVWLEPLIQQNWQACTQSPKHGTIVSNGYILDIRVRENYKNTTSPLTIVSLNTFTFLENDCACCVT